MNIYYITTPEKCKSLLKLNKINAPKTSLISCLHCKEGVSRSGFGNHYNSKRCLEKKGLISDKLSNCPHCNLNFSTSSENIGNHVRWCKDNPKYKEYRDNATGRQLQTKESIEKRGLIIKKLHESGLVYTDETRRKIGEARKGSKHSPESIEKIKKAALSSNHTRVCKKTHDYIDKKGRLFRFDSTWEDAFADRLDYLDIEWDRPQPIFYTDNQGKQRRYFPDFYLPAYDLYVDPKNKYAQKVQKEKIDILHNNINLEIIGSLEECKNWIPPK